MRLNVRGVECSVPDRSINAPSDRVQWSAELTGLWIDPSAGTHRLSRIC
jgi:hypothetical protein